MSAPKPTAQPVYTDCGNCGTCDHAGYACPCGCHAPKVRTLTCGCCTNGCVCWNHQNRPHGVFPKRCEIHTPADAGRATLAAHEESE